MKRLRFLVLLLAIILPMTTLAKTNYGVIQNNIGIVMSDFKSVEMSTDDSTCEIDNANAYSCSALRNIPKEVQFASNLFVNIIKFAVPIIMLVSYLYNYLQIRFHRDKLDVIEARLYYLRASIVPIIIFGAVLGIQIFVSVFAKNDGHSSLMDCADCFINNNCNVVYNPFENPCKDDKTFVVHGKEIENPNYDDYVEKYENTSKKSSTKKKSSTPVTYEQVKGATEDLEDEPDDPNDILYPDIEAEEDEELDVIIDPIVIPEEPLPEERIEEITKQTEEKKNTPIQYSSTNTIQGDEVISPKVEVLPIAPPAINPNEKKEEPKVNIETTTTITTTEPVVIETTTPVYVPRRTTSIIYIAPTTTTTVHIPVTTKYVPPTTVYVPPSTTKYIPPNTTTTSTTTTTKKPVTTTTKKPVTTTTTTTTTTSTTTTTKRVITTTNTTTTSTTTTTTTTTTTQVVSNASNIIHPTNGNCSKSLMDVYFLNTYTNAEETHSIGEAIVIRTCTNRYVLLDTGVQDAKSAQFIYKKLSELQGFPEKVVIDYLILSHMHNDHFGNIADLVSNPNIVVGEAIAKYDSFQSAWYNTYFKEPIEKAGIHIKDPITTEGYELQIDDKVSLKFYNVSDVFAQDVKDNKCKRNYMGIKFKLVDKSKEGNVKLNFGTKDEPLYVYIDGEEYAKGVYKYHTTSKIVYKSGGKGFNQYFYAVKTDDRKNCNTNGNSYGILATVKTDGGNRYAYFANDIDNVGYDNFEADNGVFGNMGFSRPYGANSNNADFSSVSFDKDKQDFTPLSKNVVYHASESEAARRIASDLGNDLNNIVIYQMSHHGSNNAPDAIKTLNLNRSNLYAICARGEDPNTTDFSLNGIREFSLTRTYLYSLKDANKLAVGAYSNGVQCNITPAGKTVCKQY